jgi:F-type H+-transporting ATPase subunit delta
VTPRAVARQYANALFDVARHGQHLEAVAGQLESFAALVAGHDDLRRALENPVIPPHAKRAVIEQLLDLAGDVPDALRRTLVLLAERDRFAILPDLAAIVADRVAAGGRRVPAEVVTAVPLDDARRAQLADALGRAVGRDVTLTERVDPAILGGVGARVGSVIFDGSVSRQVDRLRERLLSEA